MSILIATALQKKPIARVHDSFDVCIVAMFRGLKAVTLDGVCPLTGVNYSVTQTQISQLWDDIELEEVFP
jgi:hypothetical protein